VPKSKIRDHAPSWGLSFTQQAKVALFSVLTSPYTSVISGCPVGQEFKKRLEMP
jgi:hypothetical protein